MLYAYNIESGEYIMSMPFETEIGEGKTEIAPPKIKKNEVAVFNTEKQAWEVFKDYRFTHRMLKDNEVYAIEDFGEIPNGYQLITLKQAEAIEEEIRINKLTMTALDFIGVLQSFGLSLEQIDEYLNANLAVKMQLQYCQNVFCGVAKRLMPIEFENITITAEMVEEAFKAKHANSEEL